MPDKAPPVDRTPDTLASHAASWGCFSRPPRTSSLGASDLTRLTMKRAHDLRVDLEACRRTGTNLEVTQHAAEQLIELLELLHRRAGVLDSPRPPAALLRAAHEVHIIGRLFGTKDERDPGSITGQDLREQDHKVEALMARAWAQLHQLEEDTHERDDPGGRGAAAG